MENSNGKKCWCYLTYVFSVDDVPPLPLPRKDGQIPAALDSVLTPEAAPAIPGSQGFEPRWFFEQKFPEDEE